MRVSIQTTKWICLVALALVGWFATSSLAELNEKQQAYVQYMASVVGFCQRDGPGTYDEIKAFYGRIGAWLEDDDSEKYQFMKQSCEKFDKVFRTRPDLATAGYKTFCCQTYKEILEKYGDDAPGSSASNSNSNN